MLTVQREGFRVEGGPEWLRTTHDHFSQRHWVALPGFLDPHVLQTVQAGLVESAFLPIPDDEFLEDGTAVRRLGVWHGATMAMLQLLCNDPALFRVVREITGCPPVQFFDGSIYRLTPESPSHYPWHNDYADGRRVGLTVNLMPEPYAGGMLQIREARAGSDIQDVPNPHAGNAILFRIDRDIVHRVTPLTGGTKTAFAGWFRQAPSFMERLHASVAGGGADVC